jgi:hypothetical protein
VKNLVPLPYSRVAVQTAALPPDEAYMRAFLHEKQVWFETDFIVFRCGEACAVAHIEKTAPHDSFCRIVRVDILSLPQSTRWVEDPSVDTGNACALAQKASLLGIGPSDTLVVSGLYEHVCLIHRPQPAIIDVFDLSPPEPPRLLDLARRVLAYESFPATLLRPHVQPILDLVHELSDRPLLFPCGITQLKRAVEAFYLDEHPARQDWVLVGCERSRHIHRHFYGEDCPFVELCPRRLFEVGSRLTLMRCCLVEKKVELSGRIAYVPWGADLPLVKEGLAALVRQADAAET